MFFSKKRREEQAEKDRIYYLYGYQIENLEKASSAYRSAILPSDKEAAEKAIERAMERLAFRARIEGPQYDWSVEGAVTHQESRDRIDEAT